MQSAVIASASATMKELFDFVDEGLAESDSEHTFRHTLRFLESHNISPEPVLQWLQHAGGYCDCEVIMNAEDVFDFANPTFDKPTQ